MLTYVREIICFMYLTDKNVLCTKTAVGRF